MTLPPAIFAAAVVLAASTDFELVVSGLPAADAPICAKSREVCETARSAIRAGWWSLGLPPETPTACRPHPDCFAFESNFIAGFNMPGVPRR